MRINVRELVGAVAITADDGQKMYNLIYPAMLDGQTVDADFAGVTVVAPPFLNVAFGRLLQDISLDAIHCQLRFPNLTPEGAATLQLVIEHAARYYSDPHVRAAVERALDNYREEAEAR